MFRSLCRCPEWAGVGQVGRQARPLSLVLVAGTAATLATVAFLLVACSRPTPVSVVAPGRIQYTPPVTAAGSGVTPSPTPGPSVTPDTPPTRVVPPPEPLSAPEHFGVGLFAEGLGPVRLMAFSPTGDLFASVPKRDRIIVLPDSDRDGVADRVLTFAKEGILNSPHGIAFWPGWLYVANTDGIVRFPYELGDLEAHEEPEFLVPLPGGPKHWTRTLVFGPDRRMYVSIGSSCDVCVEEDPRRATVLRFDVDGGGAALFARGLRNAVGLAFHPATGELWATENGREQLGDDLPPDEINRLIAGGHYGWPHCFGNLVFDPELGGERDFCASTIPAAVELQANSAPLGLAFYSGTQFPEEYVGDLFVAYHGSWSRSIPTGYSVVRVPFEGGQPSGPPLSFVHGWLRPDTRRWGRPVDVIVAPDGALLISDDAGERIYRVFYARPRAIPTRMR